MQPVHHVVDAQLNRVAYEFVVGFLEEKLFLRVVTTHTDRNVRRHDDVTPVSTH